MQVAVLCRDVSILRDKKYDFACYSDRLPDYVRDAELALSFLTLPYTPVHSGPLAPTQWSVRPGNHALLRWLAGEDIG